jgi:hypothetical protein
MVKNFHGPDNFIEHSAVSRLKGVEAINES